MQDRRFREVSLRHLEAGEGEENLRNQAEGDQVPREHRRARLHDQDPARRRVPRQGEQGPGPASVSRPRNGAPGIWDAADGTGEGRPRGDVAGRDGTENRRPKCDHDVVAAAGGTTETACCCPHRRRVGSDRRHGRGRGRRRIVRCAGIDDPGLRFSRFSPAGITDPGYSVASAISSLTRVMLIARPVPSSIETTAPHNRTSPFATGKSAGKLEMKRLTIGVTARPRIELAGPHIPASQRNAVPPGNICSSAVWTWVCVPITAEAFPSRKRPIAIFSLVVSPWASTKITGVSARTAATAAATAGNGFFRIGCMNVRICTFTTPTFPFAVSSTIE